MVKSSPLKNRNAPTQFHWRSPPIRTQISLALPFLLLYASVFGAELRTKDRFASRGVGVIVDRVAAVVASGLGVVLLDLALGFNVITLGLRSGLGIILLEVSNRSPALPFWNFILVYTAF
jgi:hypothetical protein